MTEVQAYQEVYGDLVYCVPHYKQRLEAPLRQIAEAVRNILLPPEIRWMKLMEENKK